MRLPLNRTIYSFVSFAFLLAYGCKKQNLPEPELALSYESAGGNYAALSQYPGTAAIGTNYQLIPLAYTSSSRFANGDSFTFFFFSSLADASGKPLVEFTITKTFHKSQLDFSRDSSLPVIKDANDFYSVFSTGALTISCFAEGKNDGVNITITDSADRRIFQNSPSSGIQIPIQAYRDTANSFSITEVRKDLDFSTFQKINIIPTPAAGNVLSYRAAVVTIKFKCKLYGESPLNNTLNFTNATYKGLFLELIDY